MGYGYRGYNDDRGYGGYGFQPYVPVHVRRARALKALPKRLGKGKTAAPVQGKGPKIAASVWGRAWCQNLERYGDYANRIPRGRTYVRNGSVVHLDLSPGVALAYVSGSELYSVKVNVKAMAAARWKALCADCVGSIASLVELLQGDLDAGVMEKVCRPEAGLFPTPTEIDFDCSCPDGASMCKHVAAVLYGIGVRFDDDPEVLFRLRRVSAAELVAGAGKGLAVSKRGPAAGRVLAQEDVADVFGVELGDVAEPTPAAAHLPKAKPSSPKGKGKGKNRESDSGGVRGPKGTVARVNMRRMPKERRPPPA